MENDEGKNEVNKEMGKVLGYLSISQDMTPVPLQSAALYGVVVPTVKRHTNDCFATLSLHHQFPSSIFILPISSFLSPTLPPPSTTFSFTNPPAPRPPSPLPPAQVM